MDRPAFAITIKPAEASQLDLLEQAFSPGSLSRHHYQRYEVQKRGEGLYLIAWHGQTPVGHFLLRWRGPDDERIIRFVAVVQSAFLEAGGTRVAYRKKGVATALIREAERLAREQGCTRIGLEVGSTDNPDAKRLYAHLGYLDWGQGDFLMSWEYIDKQGQPATESERVTYMSKPL